MRRTSRAVGQITLILLSGAGIGLTGQADLLAETNVAAVPFARGARGGPIPGQYIVVLKDGIGGAPVAAEHARSHGAAVSHRYKHALNGYAARLSPAALAAIERDDRVRFVSEDREVFARSTCDKTTFTPEVQCLPAGIDRIDGDLSSTRSGDGLGAVNVNVAVIDTGISPHPDLNVVGGVDCAPAEDSMTSTVTERTSRELSVPWTTGWASLVSLPERDSGRCECSTKVAPDRSPVSSAASTG